MKKLLLILWITFSILTIAGAIYVIVSDGTTNAGYAVVPMVITLATAAGYRSYNPNSQNNL